MQKSDYVQILEKTDKYKMDDERVQKLVRELIIELGEDPTREGLRETPKRIASMYKEIFAGYEIGRAHV